MALTKEEVSIRLGVDGSQVNSGLLSVRQRINKFADDTQKKLGSIFKANMFMAASSLIGQLESAMAFMLPWKQEFWDGVYGVDEAGTAALEKSTENLKKLRENLKSVQDTQSKGQRDQQFNDADNLGKTAILEGELSIAQNAKKSASDALKFAKDHGATLEERTRLQIELTNALTTYASAEDALSKQQKKLTPQELQSEFNRKLNATRKGVYQDRADIGSYNQEEALGNLTPEMAAKRAAALARINTVVQARNIPKIGGAISAFKDMPFGQGIAEALEAAQTAAMQKTIIGVRIVDIEE